jgi:hypothetical protein
MKYEALKLLYKLLQHQCQALNNKCVTLCLVKENGDDMNFDWVNATNILGVYDQFVNTVKDNKDNYSREDWDEINV